MLPLLLSLSGLLLPRPLAAAMCPVQKPHMAASELDLFQKTLQSKSGGLYLEYGSGGSTSVAGHFMSHVYSVESSFEWCNGLRNQTPTRCLLQTRKLTLKCPPQNVTTHKWGVPQKVSLSTRLIYCVVELLCE